MGTDVRTHRRPPLGRALAFVVLAAIAGTACDKTPVAPTPPESFVETFSGTVGPGQSLFHPFTVRAQGSIIVLVIVTALTRPPPVPEPEEGEEAEPPPPPPPPRIGLALGTWNGATCTRLAVQESAAPGTTIVGTVLTGEFCLNVYDADNVSEPVDYLVQVTHP
jgi:hypothetical protein